MRSRIVLYAGLAAWIANVVILWLGAAPLGHDEAQYAIAAQDLIAGKYVRWFYLSKGMNLVALPGALAGGGELALRLVPMLLAIAFIFAAAHMAWRTVGATAAGWVVAVLAGTRSLAIQSSELLSDVPSATFLLLGTTTLVGELARDDGPRWRVIIAAPLFAAAFYLRYASCIPIAIVGLVAVAVWFQRFARRPAPIVVLALAFVGLLVPHALGAIETMGSPFGILLESRAVTDQFVGQGLVEYVTANPFVFYGLLAPIVMVVGLCALRRDRMAIALWLIAVASIVGIGLTTHARARYVFFPMTLLVILGVGELVRRIGALPERIRRVLVPALGVVLAIVWILVARTQARVADHRRVSMAATLAASRAIRGDSGGARCRVLGAHNTQLEHYTGCWGNMDAELRQVSRDPRVYVVDDRSKHWAAPWRPDFATLPGKPVSILEQPAVTVYRLDPD